MDDLDLTYFVFDSDRHGIDLSPFPNILRIEKVLECHPAFVAAHPSNQPDFPIDEQKWIDDVIEQRFFLNVYIIILFPN